LDSPCLFNFCEIEIIGTSKYTIFVFTFYHIEISIIVYIPRDIEPFFRAYLHYTNMWIIRFIGEIPFS